VSAPPGAAPSAPPGAALRVRALAHAYPDFLGRRRRTTLHGLDLELAPGRVLGLAGPNGSGKSTFLRVVAGIEPALAGTLEVLGGAPTERLIRSRIGYLPEDSPFAPELSGREALELAAALQGVARKERKPRSAELLALVGLQEHAGRRLGGYSRGMLRRFGLAQAWIARPELILLDEPTAGLDAQGFEVLATLLGEARGRGASVVLASHLVSDLLGACDELLVVVGGRRIAHGTPREVLGARTLLELYREHGGAARAEQRA